MALGGDLVVRLGMDSKRFSRGISQAKKKLGSFVGFATKAVTGVGVAVGAALVPAIKIASDLEETMNKFNVVFGENAGRVKEWGDNFASTVGRSQEQIARFMAGSQDLFVPLGFEPGAAETMSKQITALAIDLASFNNMSDDDTLRDLQAALTGSGEVMKKYGVIVSEAAVKQRALQMGWDPKTLTDQQKVMARLNIIMEGTTAAQGDAIRSAGSFANQMKALKATFLDTAANIGSVFLPMATKSLKMINMGIKVVVFSAQNLGLVWNVVAEAASNAFIITVARLEWFGGVMSDVLGFVGRNWREIFKDIGNFALTVMNNLGKNIIAVFKAAWDSVSSGFTDVAFPQFTSLTDGFQSSIKESLELRDFKAPTLDKTALNKYKDSLAKELGLGDAVGDSLDIGSVDPSTLGGAGSMADQQSKGNEARKTQANEAISAFSREGVEKIVTAMSGSSAKPEEATAKNTGMMAKTLKSIEKKVGGNPFAVAGATI